MRSRFNLMLIGHQLGSFKIALGALKQHLSAIQIKLKL